MPFLIILGVLLVIVFFSIAIPVIVLTAVGGTIYYFAKVNWDNPTERKNGLISFWVLVALFVAGVLVYAKFGVIGLIIGIVIVVAIGASASS